MEQFKTLIFTDERKDSLGKYANFLSFFDNEWLGSDIPILLDKRVTIDKIKELIHDHDFTGIKLISVYILPVNKSK